MEKLLAAWLELARTAPSAHNTQPWRCRIVPEGVEIYADPAHRLGPGDPTGRQTLLGIGTFIETLRLAAAVDGYQGRVSYAFHQEEAPLASVVLEKDGEPSAGDTRLAGAILKRHTNRGLYKPEPLSAEIMDSLRSCPLLPGLRLSLITDERRAAIAKLVAAGTRIGLSMRPLKEELSDLVTYQRDNAATGMLVEAMSEHPTPSTSGKEWLLRQLDVEQEADFSRRKFSESPIIAVLSSDSESAERWLQAGQSLQRLLLTAASHGLAHCISAAPVEIPTLTPELRSLSGLPGRPQAVVRFGFPQNEGFTVPSPRRGLQEILFTQGN